MIIYQNSKAGFLQDILSNDIENIVKLAMLVEANKKVSQSEINSWRGSLMYMSTVMQDVEIPDDCRVAIEYHIPQTAKRIDFIVTGQDSERVDHAVLIELKGWTETELTDKDSIIKTKFQNKTTETTHPSYQVWSYAALLNGFNQTIYEENIQLNPCAYLHNYTDDGIISNSFYAEYIQKAPVFFKQDAIKLRAFVKQHIKYGDQSDIIKRIDCGRIKPSKSISDGLVSMLKGNQEFIMIDDQKLVYETAKALAQQSSPSNKNVLIVDGGPGTGKSVVAINLLVDLINKGLSTQYVTKNAAPRGVFESKLTGTLKKTEISNLFKGSGAFVNTAQNSFDALIVDEAHRLNAKSGLYKNLGENQIKEIINASTFSVFFIDEDQRVTLDDIGEKSEIRKWAEIAGAKVQELELSSQFRCNGSDGYLAWINNTLQVRETANETLSDAEYDFRVFDSPSELRDLIFERNKENNRARLVAGYCWDWASRDDPKPYDIILNGFDFKMRWNLKVDGSTWIISPTSVNEVGCIHTCQGLDVDYIGVIIGEDLVVRNGIVITDPSKRSKNDSSVWGYQKLLRYNPVESKIILDKIIKNTYRALMTRGMRGCYIYSVDEETRAFIRSRIKSSRQ